MESDGGFEQSTPQEEAASSPQNEYRKLKRLKKKIKLHSSTPTRLPTEPDFSDHEKPPSPDLVDSDELRRSESPRSDDLGKKDGIDSLDSLLYGEDRPATKRVLEFCDSGEGFDGNRDESIGDLGLNRECGERKRGNSEEIDDENERKTKKKMKSSGDKKEKKRGTKRQNVDANGKSKTSKRKEEEERKAQFAQLADFQRQLRERRDVSFKPLPMVQKPISSVLEKIRQRKKEASEKLMASTRNYYNDHADEIKPDSDSEDDLLLERVAPKYEEQVEKDQILQPSANEPASLAPGGCDEVINQVGSKCDSPSELVRDEVPEKRFRAPVNDTQDLFSDSQKSESQGDQFIDEIDSLGEGDLGKEALSLPEMNLRLDSAPLDDMSSDEEYNDKENENPFLQQANREILSPRGDPVKDFVDEEAVEEEDSDNDNMCFQDEEENLDPEEFEDMIATDYKESPIDRERRNALHQMWLEKLDDAGTENLLQKLKYRSKQTDSIFCEEDDERDSEDHMKNGEEDESDDIEAEDDSIPPNGARLSTRQLRQMIPQMFNDKEDDFMSSDDEETEQRLKKQRFLEKVELQEDATLVPPSEDEASREVFGRIKKLNIVPEAKKRPKLTSFFDTLLTSGKSNSSKSSFLRRASNPSTSSTHKQASSASTVKSFIIFGRDDSSSRSEVPLPAAEDTVNVSDKQNQRIRNASATAKFSSSQARLRTRTAEIETTSSSSLLSVLRRSSSMQTTNCTRNGLMDHQAVFAALNSVKKPVNVEGRS